MFYIVSYDVPNDRKREKVAKTLLDFGTRVQYSVFECIVDDKLLEKMKVKLSKIVSEEDNIRIYALCGKCTSVVQVLGSGKITKDEKVYIV